jgi:uncharacterized protein
MIVSLIRNNRTFTFLTLMALMCLLLASASVRAQTTGPQIPQPTGEAVNDFADVIDPQTQQRLETILTNLKKQQNIEFGVVTVRTTGGMDIFDYALAVGRGWGIGPQEGEQQGLLLIAAIDDRKYYTLVSRHLQGELTDGLVGSIQRQYLVPAFRAGNYGEGLMQTARAYIDTLAEKRGFSTAEIYQEPSRPPASTPMARQTRPRSSLSGGCTCLIIIIIVLILLLSSRGGGRGSGCLNLFLLSSLLNTGSRGWSSSGWGSGGGFGGGGGGGGGGFGGFGGGGDFDGGGAGGSW